MSSNVEVGGMNVLNMNEAKVQNHYVNKKRYSVHVNSFVLI